MQELFISKNYHNIYRTFSEQDMKDMTTKSVADCRTGNLNIVLIGNIMEITRLFLLAEQVYKLWLAFMSSLERWGVRLGRPEA